MEIQHRAEVCSGSKASFGRAACRFPVYREKQTCLVARRDFAFSPNFSREPALLQPPAGPSSCARLSYMKDLPREHAESQQIGVDGGGSKNRDLTPDPLGISTEARHGKSIYRRPI
jgi:hypothetical protein